MTNTPAPETEAERDRNYKISGKAAVSVEFAARMEVDRDAWKSKANALGTQLDLVRDELLRIGSRIIESDLLSDLRCREILDYCDRAQKDIAVNYTPIQEVERLQFELVKSNTDLAEAVEDRDAWKAKAERKCKHVKISGGVFVAECENVCEEFDAFCPDCGGRIVKEGQ